MILGTRWHHAAGGGVVSACNGQMFIRRGCREASCSSQNIVRAGSNARGAHGQTSALVGAYADSGVACGFVGAAGQNAALAAGLVTIAAHRRSHGRRSLPEARRQPPGAQGTVPAADVSTAELSRSSSFPLTSLAGSQRALHPAGRVLKTGYVEVADGFELYFEQHGDQAGVPAVFLHGGPGAGCSQRMAQLFDPKKYCVTLFDQRGCGRSMRKGLGAERQLDGNTTWHLVEDIEVLRVHLGIERWVVGGGSWGTLLALAYASRHQDRVLGIVLRAVCLFRNQELEFFCGPGPGGARSLVSAAAWQRFAGWMPQSQNESARSIASAFRRAALGGDAGLSPSEAVRKWQEWENCLFATSARRVQLLGPAMAASPKVPLEASPPSKPWPELGIHSMQALLTIHYVAERAFFPPGFELLDAVRDFRFPLKVVHGRGDCICPVANAEDLRAAGQPGCVELLLTEGGHSQWDPLNVNAFVRATDNLADTVLVKA